VKATKKKVVGAKKPSPKADPVEAEQEKQEAESPAAKEEAAVADKEA
jgi:hypothetical protein